ncbi:beta and beta-prime subunits of DNA dependent RNA-polymerase [Pleurotus eryngii]|uniref:DNA-directed RNA polymerase n=1 Tax=Pleurotus eryngii TaxID=5323 RepID=A0A9P5ZNC7_PLEER|nr:beta and beta-prime subunits of DNA dependent RNA-polymerase [Pleurotus eryngii]
MPRVAHHAPEPARSAGMNGEGKGSIGEDHGKPLVVAVPVVMVVVVVVVVVVVTVAQQPARELLLRHPQMWAVSAAAIRTRRIRALQRAEDERAEGDDAAQAHTSDVQQPRTRHLILYLPPPRWSQRLYQIDAIPLPPKSLKREGEDQQGRAKGRRKAMDAATISPSTRPVCAFAYGTTVPPPHHIAIPRPSMLTLMCAIGVSRAGVYVTGSANVGVRIREDERGAKKKGIRSGRSRERTSGHMSAKCTERREKSAPSTRTIPFAVRHAPRSTVTASLSPIRERERARERERQCEREWGRGRGQSRERGRWGGGRGCTNETTSTEGLNLAHINHIHTHVPHPRSRSTSAGVGVACSEDVTHQRNSPPGHFQRSLTHLLHPLRSRCTTTSINTLPYAVGGSQHPMVTSGRLSTPPAAVRRREERWHSRRGREGGLLEISPKLGTNKGCMNEDASSLVHVIFREKSPEGACALFSGSQKVVNYQLFTNGFGSGIGDTIADAKIMALITQTIASHNAEVTAITERAIIDELKTAPVMTIRESFESQVERHFNLARDTSCQYAQKNLKEDNNMSVCVGQQSVEGRHIPFGFRHRTLPHFTKDDFSPEARGFVENSYLRGLTPQESFHAVSCPEGLIDAAAKTPETGYILRRLVKALKDVQVCYDGTVRSSLGNLIQFVYGEDGMDGAFIEKQNIATFGVNHVQFKHNYHVDIVDPTGGFLLGVLQVGVDDSSPELQAKLDKEMLGQIFHIDLRKPSDLEPAYIVDAVRDLVKRLIVVRGDDALSREAQTNTTLNFSMHLRATFASRRRSEPATQMTLNTFHYAGVSGKNVTLGAPRLKEIINVANNIKTPSLLNQYIVKNVQQELAYTTLRTVTAAVEIWYNPDPSSTFIEDYVVFVESFFAIPDEEISSKLHPQSPWLLRLELD